MTIYNMIVIAEGFMQSSLLLTKRLLDDNEDKISDIVIYPILFNANHAIELYLKAITWTFNILLEKPYKIEGIHNIQQILQVVKKRGSEFEKDPERKKAFHKLLEGTRIYIDELFAKIQSTNITDEKHKKDNMDFSRYPFDEKYTPHFYVNELDNVVVDLENFLVRFTEIGTNLKLIAEYYLYDFLEADNK